MATSADVKLALALRNAREGIEQDQAKIVRQNRKASLGSGIGRVLGAIVGGLLTGGNPLGAAAGSRLFSEIGERATGGFEGGEIGDQLFFQDDIRRQNRLFDEARSDMNLEQWTDAVMAGVTQGAGNVAQGGQFMGNFNSSLMGTQWQRMLDTIQNQPVTSGLSSAQTGSSLMDFEGTLMRDLLSSQRGGF